MPDAYTPDNRLAREGMRSSQIPCERCGAEYNAHVAKRLSNGSYIDACPSPDEPRSKPATKPESDLEDIASTFAITSMCKAHGLASYDAANDLQRAEVLRLIEAVEAGWNAHAKYV